MRMKNTLETRLGLFIALAMIAAFIILELLGGRDIFKPGYNLRAEFSNVQELKVGDPVKMAGVPVGRVERISLDTTNSKVSLTLRLVRDTPVKTDSKASIKFAGLLGQNYVSIDFGSAAPPRLEPGQLIATIEQP